MSNTPKRPYAPIAFSQEQREALFPDIYGPSPIRIKEPHFWLGNAGRSIGEGAALE